jgi:hypothetical protein
MGPNKLFYVVPYRVETIVLQTVHQFTFKEIQNFLSFTNKLTAKLKTVKELLTMICLGATTTDFASLYRKIA